MSALDAEVIQQRRSVNGQVADAVDVVLRVQKVQVIQVPDVEGDNAQIARERRNLFEPAPAPET
jgi:hypothetical protein